MKYQLLECNNIYGRLANQLYPILFAFSNTSTDIKTYIIENVAIINFNLLEKLYSLGCKDYIVKQSDLTKYSPINTTIIHNQHSIPPYGYKQIFNESFQFDKLNEFIEKCILKSSLFNECHLKYKHILDNSETVCAIHIRNGDYINSSLDIFDRQSYIEKMIFKIKKQNTNLSSIYVISDDNDLNIKLYDKTLKEQFVNVIYVKDNQPEYDLMLLSLFKYKILWNSTFSYWAGFIGNCIHKKSYDCVYVPAFFGNTKGIDRIGDHVNPLWNLYCE